MTGSSKTPTGGVSSSYSFHVLFDAKTPKAFTQVYKDLLDENHEPSQKFIKKLKGSVTKVAAEKKKDEELMDIFASKCEESDLRLAFDLFDVDSDGYLNEEEINGALKALGEQDFELPKSVKKLDFEQFNRLLKA